MKTNNKKDFLHILYTPWTGLGLRRGFRGDKWYEARIRLFKNYTIESLRNQSCKDFIHWCSFRPEEKNNPRTIELAEYLEKIGYPAIFTFDGLMWWDDKFPLRLNTRVILSILRDFVDHRGSPIKFIKDYLADNKKNETLQHRLQESLDYIKDTLGLARKEWVYESVLATDDMYEQDAFKIIQEQKPEYRKALLYSKGYVLNHETGQIAQHNPTTCQPFYTVIYPWKRFWNAKKHLEYVGDFESHEDITRIFNTKKIDERRYMISCHDQNISTRWYQTRFRSAMLKMYKRDNFIHKDYPEEEKERILSRFGLKKNIYLTRIESDDMYGKDTIKSIQEVELQQSGTKSVDGYEYCFVAHGRNLSTTWEGKTGEGKAGDVGVEFKGQKKKKLLNKFGIKENER